MTWCLWIFKIIWIPKCPFYLVFAWRQLYSISNDWYQSWSASHLANKWMGTEQASFPIKIHIFSSNVYASAQCFDEIIISCLATEDLRQTRNRYKTSKIAFGHRPSPKTAWKFEADEFFEHFIMRNILVFFFFIILHYNINLLFKFLFWFFFLLFFSIGFFGCFHS